ncbi:MAG TPA: TonB-dependent receptor [Polyangiaceae bacterium]|nr:TonB-dependent receptor [Polyangiaceae bacterium]
MARPRLTRPPKLAKFVEAPYPETEKASGRTASVVVQIAISATGTVEAVKVIESAGPAFDAAAVTAVQQFLFEPAEVDNRPSPIRINYRYDFVIKEEAPTTAQFAGVVKNHQTGEALAGVTIALDTGVSVLTDEAGRFALEAVEPGKHRVTLSRTDLKPLQSEEIFEAGKKVDATYEVEFNTPDEDGDDADSDDLEIVIIAPTLSKQVVSTKVEADQARRVAGTSGDVLKIVENLPGVARATAGSGAVVVWGAAPEDTRVYVDGMRVPLLYHFGGFRSVIHSDFVRSVELIPGGYGAQYGRGLGGLVKVDTRDPASDRLHGSAGVDLIDASAAITSPIGKNFSAAIAARRSHLDAVLNELSSRDTSAFFPIPKYYDGQARVRYQPAKQTFVELGGMISSDDVARTVGNADPAYRKEENRHLSFQRIYLRYETETADGGKVSAMPWLGWDRSTLTGRFGGTPTVLEVDSHDYGFRASYRGRVAPFLTTEVGLDLEASTHSARRVGSVTAPPREGDARAFGQPPSDQVNLDTWQTADGSAAPYVEGDFSLFENKLHIVPGLRLEPQFTSVSKRVPTEGVYAPQGVFTADTALQPRVAVHYALSPRVTLKAAAGQYRQAAQPQDLSASFGNPTLQSSRATHLLFGGAFELNKNISLETTVFHNSSDDLVARNPSSSPLIAQALVNGGEGRSYGAQFLLRHQLAHGFFGWVAYTMLRSERKDAGTDYWRLFDYDQTHVLTALASYDLGKGFDIGVRGRYASGYPRTPVVGSYFDARTATHQPVLGDKNSIRIPAFVELDVRVAKRFKFQSSSLEIYLDVQNVTNRKNPEEIAYNANYSERRYVEGLPILPVLGVKWDF